MIKDKETKDIIRLIDLTLLSDDDNNDKITALCQKAKKYHTAAVCIKPQFVSLAADLLQGSKVKIATVVNFPTGDGDLQTTQADIEQAIADKADEIDVVFPYRAWLNGDKEYAKNFIDSCKEACGNDVKLKVILETGEIKDDNLIYEITMDAITAGADFVKTSTGKTPVSATPKAATSMIKAVKDSGIKNIGIKIAGGVATKDEALSYIIITKGIMGEKFISASSFRFGASRLLDNLIATENENKDKIRTR